MTVYQQSNHLIKREDTIASYKTHSVDEFKKVMVSFFCNTSIQHSVKKSIKHLIFNNLINKI